MTNPAIIHSDSDFAVLYKPPSMHTVPLRLGEGGTLLEWAAGAFPEALKLRGKKAVEGGIVHRLDFLTGGLVLLARTEKALVSFNKQQEDGLFVKEYCAQIKKTGEPLQAVPLQGFPPPPMTTEAFLQKKRPFVIESAFRPFGKGRAAVRPLIAADTRYKTEIIDISGVQDAFLCRVRLTRGARHQIRCHLAWLGLPIINDPLYGELSTPSLPLALSALKLQFHHPATSELLEFELGEV